MAKIALNVISTEAATGKKLQKTLTDINATATSTQIKTFTTALNGLTTNNYVETNRIEKKNVDTEETGGIAKLIPTLTISEFSEGSATVTYSGDGALVLKVISGTITLEGNTVTATGNAEGVIYALATDTYASAVLPFTVTA